MKIQIKKSLFLALALIIASGLSMSLQAQTKAKKPWTVPDASKNMKNPKKSDKETISAGKANYEKFCKSCHGAKGLGDGPKSKTLDTPCGDFTKDLTSQSDGDLCYKIKEGRDDMPSFKKKIPDDNDVWGIVVYLRSLAEGK